MSPENQDTYYNYDDYCFFKKKFDDAYSTSKEKSVNEDNIIIKSIHTKIKDRFIKLCAAIKDYLSHSDIKPLNGVTKTCNYINFYLRTELKDQKYYDKNDTFDNIKIFFQFDDKIKNNSCISNMKYIDDLIFNKMKKLYKLYDAYEAFCEQIDIHEDLTNCNTLSDVINDFNGIIKSHKYPNSIYLFKELKKFKCLIEKNDLFTSGKCVSILPQLSTPQGDSTKDEVQCINQGQSEHRPGKFDVSPIHAMPMGEREPKEPLSVSQPSRSGVTIPLISGMTGMFGILLYKYTPVGNKLRHLIHGKSQISNNMHDEKYKLYINNFENETNDLVGGRRYDISYYSLDNS